MSFSNVVINGNLTRDPEIRTAGQHKVCKMGVAINRRWRDRDGNQKEETTFVDVECWGKTAEICAQHLTKGAPVTFVGRLQLDQWEDKDGKKQSKLKVVANHVELGSRAQQKPQSEAPSGIDDEPPF